jgi:hypothetical protein
MFSLGKFLALFVSTVFWNLDMNHMTFYFPVLPAVFQIITLRCLYTEETPMHLWLNGKKSRVNARQAIQLIGTNYNHNDIRDSPGFSTESILEQQERRSRKVSYIEVLTSSSFRKPLFIVCGKNHKGLGLFRTFLGPDTMLYIIMTKLVDLKLEWLILMVFYGANLLASLSCFFFFESKTYIGIGRLPLLKLGALAMFLLYVILTIYAQMQVDIVYLILAGALIAIYELSLGTVL